MKKTLDFKKAHAHLKDALESILHYTEAKKPKTINETDHMLSLIGVIARESLKEAAVMTAPSTSAPAP